MLTSPLLGNAKDDAMRAFYFENNTTQRIPPPGATGHILVGHLELNPGDYLIWGKMCVGTNANSGYPPPGWPHGGGAATLAYADGSDQAYVSIKPDSGENNDTVSLILAAQSDRSRKARLYFINPYPLAVFVNTVRIIALQVESVTPTIVGEDHTNAPIDQQEAMRDAIMSARLRADWNMRITEDD